MKLHGFCYTWTQEYIYAIFLMLAGNKQPFRLEEVINLLSLGFSKSTSICKAQYISVVNKLVSEFHYN